MRKPLLFLKDRLNIGRKKEMGRKIMQHVFTLIALLGIAAALFLGYKLIQKEMDYRKGQKALEDVYRVMDSVVYETREQSGSDGTEDRERESERQERLRLAQYEALNRRNPDMQGWIHIEGTKVDYPVMYTPKEPEFYINRNFDKERSSYGMIFIDGDCRMDQTSPNILIYGHHMKNGDMFAEIENYDSSEFQKAHPYVEFDTLSETGTYQVLAAFKQPASRLDEDFKTMMLAEDEEQYGKLMDYLKAHRFYDTGVEAVWPEQLITLTTCEYTQKDGRFFVVAKRVEDGD